MRASAGVALAALVLAGCPKSSPHAVADAGPAQAADAADAGWQLTPAALDAWLTYQRRWLAGLARPDGGTDGGASARELRRRARLDEDLRADAGLSEDDVDRIEVVVAAVATRRAIAALSGAELTAELEKAAASLTGEKRQQAEKALADLKARAGQASDLSAERARFGDAGVDAVLARDAEVRAVWDAMLEARAP